MWGGSLLMSLFDNYQGNAIFTVYKKMCLKNKIK